MASFAAMLMFVIMGACLMELAMATLGRGQRNQTSTAHTKRVRQLSYLSCGTGNPVDDCWRCDANWESNRQRLADCAVGFGRNAVGGRDGRLYVVTDPSDDPVDPRPGTLRHAIIQTEPLWIMFQRDMVIQAKQELMVSSYKTIDGRGANVHIANGGCLTVHYVSHVIIHGIHIHDCVPRGNAMVRTSPSHVEMRPPSDGDGISILASTDVWVDHCALSSCADGLIDVTHASSGVTVSNNFMTHHDKVMLLGHSDDFTADTALRVSVAYNHFGEGLVQRMPRCRHGVFDVVNNDYTHWLMYAIGGSASPTINSRGNRFLAMAEKQVTKREEAAESEWRNWNWRSEGDLFLNGAFFVASGSSDDGAYSRASSLSARPSDMVASLTSSAGVLSCRKGSPC